MAAKEADSTKHGMMSAGITVPGSEKRLPSDGYAPCPGSSGTRPMSSEKT